MKSMKYLICCMIVFSIAGCNIEGAVKDASERCEDEIAKIIQSVEATCLTKDELLRIIYEVRDRNDQRNDCVETD